MGGFFAAWALPIWAELAGVLALELIAGVFGRDNLSLSSNQLVAPIDDWQQQLNSRNVESEYTLPAGENDIEEPEFSRKVPKIL